MNLIKKTVTDYLNGKTEKPSYIKLMYEQHHARLFEYAAYMKETNIQKIEIEDDNVIMTSRDRGVRMNCSTGDFRIAPIETLNFFDYEKLESNMMENLLSDGDTLFDIGANIGWYSINLGISRRASKIHAFEPIPETYLQLQKNISLNPCVNINAHNFGFSNEEGEFPFFYYSEGSGNASSANLTERDDVISVTCKVRTLDDFVKEARLKVDFIKCDVEGAELLVFKGGINTILRDKPIIFSEILRKWSAKFSYNPNEIFDLFRNQGYQAFTVTDQYLTEFFTMDEYTVQTNFFFLHTEKHKVLLDRFKIPNFE
jgi:FkbM family methyltransferase